MDTSRSDKRQAKGTIYLINIYNRLTVGEQRFYRNLCLRDRVLLEREKDERKTNKRRHVTFVTSWRRNRDKITRRSLLLINVLERAHCDFLDEGREIVIAAVILEKGARSRSIRSFAVSHKNRARSACRRAAAKRRLYYSTRGFIEDPARRKNRVRHARRGLVIAVTWFSLVHQVENDTRESPISAACSSIVARWFPPSRLELARKVLINAAINSSISKQWRLQLMINR